MFIGDIMSHGNQIRTALTDKQFPNLSQSYDYSSYFKFLKSRISQNDFIICNFEAPINTPPYSGYPFFSAPLALLEECASAGFNVFLTANNHICDQGESGFENTISAYENLGLKFTGIYRNSHEEESNNPLIILKKDVKIAIINASYSTNGLAIPKGFVVNLLDFNKISNAISRAKAANADIIIFCPHWGDEYQLFSNVSQKTLAKKLFALGVDIIVGHHPHVTQELVINYKDDLGLEKKIESLVCYSLGNAISNQTSEFTRIGTILHISIVKKFLENKIEICSVNKEYHWTSHPGFVEPNYCILPISDFLNKEEQFLNKEDYKNMINQYKSLKKIYNE